MSKYANKKITHSGKKKRRVQESNDNYQYRYDEDEGIASDDETEDQYQYQDQDQKSNDNTSDNSNDNSNDNVSNNSNDNTSDNDETSDNYSQNHHNRHHRRRYRCHEKCRKKCRGKCQYECDIERPCPEPEPECCKPSPCSKECRIHPECPLKLLKYTGFSTNGDITSFLALAGDIHIIVFKNIQYIMNRALSFVIPKCICDNCGNCYTLSLDPDVQVDDLNGNHIAVKTVEAQDKFYVVIPITDGMITDCNLTLYFIKLKIDLTPTETCDCSTYLCSDAWRWIPSVITD